MIKIKALTLDNNEIQLKDITTDNNQTILNQTNFSGTSFPSEWIQAGGWSVNDGLQSPSTGGWNTYALWNKHSALNKKSIKLKVTIVDATSKFSIIYKPPTWLQTDGTIFEIDCLNKQINIYKCWDGTSNASIAYSYTIPFNIVVNQEYLIELNKNEGVQNFKLANEVTGDKISLSHDNGYNNGIIPTHIGNEMGYAGIMFHNGNILVTNCCISTPISQNPYISFYGDSMIEGDAITSYPGGCENRWCYKILEKVMYINKDVILSGISGAKSNDVIQRLDIDLDKFNPAYSVVLIGTNENNYSIWKTNYDIIIQKILSKNSIPILCTILPRPTNQTVINQMNMYIKSLGYTVINFASIFSINNDEVTQNTSLFLNDYVHPNIQGNNLMYEQFLINCSDLIYDIGRIVSPKDLESKSDKISNPVENNILLCDAEGNPKDSGTKLSDISISVPDTTSTKKGIIQLTGDLGGTASLPKVIGLQGIPFDSSTFQDGSIFTIKNGKISDVIPSGIIGSVLITTIGTNVTIASGTEQLFNHNSASSIIPSIVEVIAGSSVTDTHNDFNAASNYVQQDSSVGTVIGSGSGQLIQSGGVDSYTKLMMHMDAFPFVDEIGNTLVNTNVVLDTTIKKFGNASAKAINSYIDVPINANLQLYDTNAFTIDFQLYKTVNNTTMTLMEATKSTTGMDYGLLILADDGSGKIQIKISTDGTGNSTTSINLFSDSTTSLGVFLHCAVVFTGSQYMLFINGAKQTTVVNDTRLPCIFGQMRLFARKYTGSEQPLTGYVDEFRISKGIARYTSNFTPQISAYYKYQINTPYYITTTGASNTSLSTVATITSLTIPTTTPANTSIKALFSVDNRNTWLYKDGTGIHKFTGDLIQAWTSYNAVSDITTYFTNLAVSQLTTDLSSLNIVPVSLDFAFQLQTSDNTQTPMISSITLVYQSASHEEFGFYGDYLSTKADYGIKRVNSSTLSVKNLTSTSKTIKLNVVLGS